MFQKRADILLRAKPGWNMTLCVSCILRTREYYGGDQASMFLPLYTTSALSAKSCNLYCYIRSSFTGKTSKYHASYGKYIKEEYHAISKHHALIYSTAEIENQNECYHVTPSRTCIEKWSCHVTLWHCRSHVTTWTHTTVTDEDIY